MRNIRNILLLLFIIHFNSFAQNADKGILKYNWVMDPNNSYNQSKGITTTTPYSMFLETLRDEKGIILYSTPLQTNNNPSKVNVRISYKSNNCSELYLKLINIGEGEKTNSIDTLHLPLNNDWRNLQQTIEVKGALTMAISIEAKGLPNENGQVWIDKMDMLVDGQNAVEYEPEVKVSITKDDIIPLRDENLADFPLRDKRILAIGESIHGSETLNSLAIDIIKDRIINNNSKLVLMEIPLEYSFYINRYIDGDESFKLDSISYYFENSLFSNSLVSLIDWMKKYNSNTPEKVHFIGINHNFFMAQSRSNLFDFFYPLYQATNNEKIKELCMLLLDDKDSFDDVIAFYEANDGFKDVLNKDESELMHYLFTLINQKEGPSHSFVNRDITMFKNTEFVMEKLLKEKETVTLYCHLGHLNYRTPLQGMIDMDYFSLGKYMKDKYKDDYSCVGLLAETGSYLSISRSYFKIAELRPSPTNSLEYLINNLNMDKCYLSMEKLANSDMIKTRHIGSNQLQEEFFFMVPKARMDGVIFTKQSSAIQKGI